MARALIVTPDLDHPGGVILTELQNLADAWVEDNGVLVVKRNVEDYPVHFAPGAWHSWTVDDDVHLKLDAWPRDSDLV